MMVYLLFDDLSYIADAMFWKFLIENDLEKPQISAIGRYRQGKEY